ncbi:MAG TPA: histidine kinase [Steroidobacteraceae bacterium]|nr:histidine kinase [Steroidobacteraceae bacterium]
MTERGLNMLSLLGVLSVYWCYVALSNVLYAHSMQATIEDHWAFAPPLPRLLQHAFLYPLLMGSVWISLRVGWRPVWRAVPVQVLMGLGFAVLSRPALIVGEIIDGSMGHTWAKVFAERASLISGTGLATWAASTLSFLLTYGFGLALVTGLSWYQRYRDSQERFDALERSLSATRLAALRMQLSPHTLFNLLHTIRGQIAWDPSSAQTMVVQLGDVLRRLLAAGERDFSRLADELEFVRLYLELQRSRFSDRLSFHISELGELNRLWVPSLILQPLVENAVAHGLSGHAGAVHVSVEASSENGTLKLAVTNTTASDTVAGAQGIGLRNVRERLVLHFPDSATFRASPADAQTWVAEIQMPLVLDARGNRSAP